MPVLQLQVLFPVYICCKKEFFFTPLPCLLLHRCHNGILRFGTKSSFVMPGLAVVFPFVASWQIRVARCRLLHTCLSGKEEGSNARRPQSASTKLLCRTESLVQVWTQDLTPRPLPSIALYTPHRHFNETYQPSKQPVHSSESVCLVSPPSCLLP